MRANVIMVKQSKMENVMKLETCGNCGSELLTIPQRTYNFKKFLYCPWCGCELVRD